MVKEADSNLIRDQKLHFMSENFPPKTIITWTCLTVLSCMDCSSCSHIYDPLVFKNTGNSGIVEHVPLVGIAGLMHAVSEGNTQKSTQIRTVTVITTGRSLAIAIPEQNKKRIDNRWLHIVI